MAISAPGLPEHPPASRTPLAPRPTLRREWLLLGLSVLVLVGVVVPPLVNLGRYQHRIIEAMSRSLGRTVTMQSVTLRLLPAPALVLTDVAVNEDPAFGEEPALRAPTVVAELRLTSLWRGRLEVSRVEMSEASLNLVRDAHGRWNIGSVLLQASHVPNAPTGQRRPGPTPRFPYIEISDSRVNVKQGAEKLPYSLLNTNLSMWLAEPDVWGIKLEGQPVRTDLELGLSDTGLLQLEGKLHRASSVGYMPVALHADWSNAPLGQASRLLLGRDPGWRGELHATADISGELDSLAVKTHLVIANLHREEFTPAEPFSVDATCRAAYSRAAHALSDIACRWPVGGGGMLLTGNVALGAASSQNVGGQAAIPPAGSSAMTAAGPAGSPGHVASPGPALVATPGATSLQLAARQLPAGFLLAAAGLARRDFAPGFTVTGALSGTLGYRAQAGALPTYDGWLEAPTVTLQTSGAGEPVTLREVRLAALTPTPSGVPTLEITAAPIDLGGAAPVVVDGQMSAQGVLLHASGGAALERLEEVGRATRLLPTALAWLGPQGEAEFDVTRSTAWQPDNAAAPSTNPGLAGPLPSSAPSSSAPASSPFATAVVTHGWLRLHGARYTPPFLPEAVLLPTAQATLLPGEIAWSAPAAVFHHMPMQLMANYPLGCVDGPCPVRFSVEMANLDAGDLTAALLGGDADEGHLLDALMSRLDPHRTGWPPMTGTVHADTFTLGRMAVRGADATLSIAGNHLQIVTLRGKALGGSLATDGTLEMDGRTARYALHATLTNASVTAAGNLFRENWGPGSLTVATHLTLSGLSAADLAASAAGDFHGEWQKGALGGPTRLSRFADWTGDGVVGGSALTFTHGELTTGSGARPVPLKGTIGFDRALNLQLGGPGDEIVTVGGTLSHPSE